MYNVGGGGLIRITFKRACAVSLTTGHARSHWYYVIYVVVAYGSRSI